MQHAIGHPPPAERVELIYRCIKEEIRSPSKPDRESQWTEDRYHEYLLTCLLLSGMAGVAGETRESRLKLRDFIAKEGNQEVKEILQVALSWIGDKTVWLDLVGIIKQKHHPMLRAGATTGLVCCNAKLAIPDLIEALKDPQFAIEDDQINPYGHPPFADTVKRPVFQVRRAAAGALDDFGIKVCAPDKTKPFEFVVDRDSAVKVLKAELENKDKEHVKQAIEAIARVGGPAAKAELRRFCEQREGDPTKTESVLKATEALSRMEASKK